VLDRQELEALGLRMESLKAERRTSRR